MSITSSAVRDGLQAAQARSHGAGNSVRIACEMTAVSSSAIAPPFSRVAPRAEDSTPEGGTHSVRVGIHVVGRKVGRSVIGDRVEAHQVWVVVQHHRGLDHRRMLQRVAGKAVGEDLGERAGREEVPVLHAHHAQAARRPQLAHRQVDALDQEPLVLVVSVDHDQLAHAVAMKLAHGVAHGRNQRGRIQAGGAGEVLAAAALGLRLEAIGERRRDDAADLVRHAFGYRARQQRIGAERQMRTMLFRGAHRQQHRRAALQRALAILGPAQSIHQDGLHRSPAIKNQVSSPQAGIQNCSLPRARDRHCEVRSAPP